MSTAKESDIEEYLDAQVVLLGGFTVKLNPKGYKGIPDRLVVLPGRMFVVELKRPKGGVTARLQTWWQQRFHDLGHPAYIAPTQKAVLDLLRDAR